MSSLTFRKFQNVFFLLFSAFPFDALALAQPPFQAMCLWAWQHDLAPTLMFTAWQRERTLEMRISRPKQCNGKSRHREMKEMKKREFNKKTFFMLFKVSGAHSGTQGALKLHEESFYLQGEWNLESHKVSQLIIARKNFLRLSKWKDLSSTDRNRFEEIDFPI
jgi:hypothetical protein